ncbi:hypothetical protein CLOM_g4365 [Closterium sp. NIES-68]|nr:hypothetical protein CLOM_g4365 [Closterium sp. NIES-68]GJP86918.1 hypothetical protein CLOP_g16886 [Closterium sp. NIES-67]
MAPSSVTSGHSRLLSGASSNCFLEPKTGLQTKTGATSAKMMINGCSFRSNVSGSTNAAAAVAALLVMLLAASALPLSVRASENKLLPCTYSGLKGYTSSSSPFKGLRLHWKVVGGKTVKIDLRASPALSKGWFGVGFSTDGEMTGDAIVVPSKSATAPKILALTGESGSSVAESTDWTPAKMSIKRTGRGASLKFERTASDGSIVTINPKGKNILMFAYKTTAWDTNEEHDKDAHVMVDFACNPCKRPLGFLFCRG